MKRILKKGLISILIVLILVNFISANTINVVYGNDAEDLLNGICSGLIGVITWIPRAKGMAALLGINKLITAIVHFGLDGIEGYGVNDVIDPFGVADVSYITPFHIFFNKIALIDVNFLNFEGVSGTVETFRTAVAGWYYTMRLIACMVLAVILIYIGIRMAISTIASEKAMYKKMLVDWVTSLALLFLLHYIMLFTFACNDALVKAIEVVCERSNLDSMMTILSLEAFGVQIVEAVGAMILFGIVIGQTLSFLFAYVKRMLTIGFLIMIAPLITITYSIDKIGDGKAQALNTWLKEFVYNVLIQPFHCILFAAFASVAMRLIQDTDSLNWDILKDTSIGALVLAVCCIQFIKTGEELVKKIFGFGQASSLTTMAAGAAMTMAALNKGTSVGKKIGSGAAKVGNKIKGTSVGKKISSGAAKLSNKAGGLTKRFDKFERNADGSIKTDKNGNALLTARGQRIAEKKAKKHQENYTNIANQMADRDIKSKVYTAKNGVKSKMKTMKENRENKKETKRQEKAVALAKQRLAEKGVTRPPNDEEIASARKQVDAKEATKKEKRAKITGAVGHINDSVGGFLDEHGKDISKIAGGFVMATIGMGAGGMSGALIGAKFGSGVVDGYMSNTNQTIQNELEGDLEAAKQLSDDSDNFDAEAKIYALYAKSQNGGFDKVEEKLDKILDKISNLTSAQKQSFRNNIQKQLIKDPRGLNESFLRDMATDEFKLSGTAVDEAVSGMKQYARLATDVKLAQSINTATNTRTIEQVATAVSYINNNTINNNDNTVNEDITVYQKVKEAEASGRAEDVATEESDSAMRSMTQQPHEKDIPNQNNN